MAFTLKNIVRMLAALAFAFLSGFNIASVSALPAGDEVALDMPNSLVARNTSMALGCPPGQPPNQAGCSSCAECCIFQFNDAGCGIYSVIEMGLTDFGCHTMFIGMNNVWITECTGAFAECMLWSNDDCTGEGSWSIENGKDICHHTQYWIKSIQCFQSSGPDRARRSIGAA